MNPHLWVGLPGLATDIQTVKQKIEFRMNMYELKETRQMRPKTFANMVSNMLYERRFGPFFVEPIVAGLDPETHAPYICNMDLIGELLTLINTQTLVNEVDQYFTTYKKLLIQRVGPLEHPENPYSIFYFCFRMHH